jgi:Rv2632c-like
MSAANRWWVALSIQEHEGTTRAEAYLFMDDGTQLEQSSGVARLNPADPNVTGIGEKVAVARALSDLAGILLRSAAAESSPPAPARLRVDLPRVDVPPGPDWDNDDEE